MAAYGAGWRHMGTLRHWSEPLETGLRFVFRLALVSLAPLVIKAFKELGTGAR